MWVPKKIAFVFNSAVDNQQALHQVFSTAINNQASLTLISIFNPSILSFKLSDDFTPVEELEDNLKVLQKQALDDSQRHNPELDWDKIDVTFTVLAGDPDLETVKEVIRGNYDLLIKTVDNQGLLKRVFGREDMRLLRNTPCPVWLVQSQGLKSADAHSRKILAAVDVNALYKDDEMEVRRELNLKILETAYSLAISESTDLHVVSAWSAPFENSLASGFIREPAEKIEEYVTEIERTCQRNFDQLMARLAERFGTETQHFLNPKTALIKGSPDTVITQQAKDIGANLVVMGTVARRGIAGLVMGNTAESILDRLGQSVIAIKPTGFVSPVKL